MKLKRLLPIASVAGVAAVVAPIVTSCGVKYDISQQFELDDKGQIKSEYKPDYEQAKADTYSIEDANKMYFDALSKNKNMFAKEYFRFMYENPQNFSSEIFEVPLNVSLAGKFGSIKVDATNQTLSFNGEVVGKSKMVLNANGDSDATTVTCTSTYTIKISNIPFKLTYDESFAFVVDYAKLLKTDSKWSINLSMKDSLKEGSIAKGEASEEITGNSNMSNIEKQGVVEAARHYLIVQAPWYLENITIK